MFISQPVKPTPADTSKSAKGSRAMRGALFRLTARTQDLLATRAQQPRSNYVFENENSSGPLLVSSLDHQHARIRKALKLPREFVLHSLRHSYLSRLGLAGVEAFTIMKLAGHSSVTVSQKYVHPTAQSLEQAVDRLDGMNGRTLAPREVCYTEPEATAVPTTASLALSVSH
jgi:integrase